MHAAVPGCCSPQLGPRAKHGIELRPVRRGLSGGLEQCGVKPLPRLNVWMNGLPLGKSVLTNTHQPGFVPDHLERLGIAHLVERVTSSVEHGQRKPDPRIYRDHLAGLGLAIDQVLFVGDNPECDFHGPRCNRHGSLPGGGRTGPGRGRIPSAGTPVSAE